MKTERKIALAGNPNVGKSTVILQPPGAKGDSRVICLSCFCLHLLPAGVQESLANNFVYIIQEL